MKLIYTKKEIEDIKSKIYFTDDELKILDMWLVDKSVFETSYKLNLSERTIIRRRKSILDKIEKVG